jgi:hypothetical protein
MDPAISPYYQAHTRLHQPVAQGNHKRLIFSQLHRHWYCASCFPSAATAGGLVAIDPHSHAR